jgi:hypothetical protein
LLNDSLSFALLAPLTNNVAEENPEKVKELYKK